MGLGVLERHLAMVYLTIKIATNRTDFSEKNIPRIAGKQCDQIGRYFGFWVTF